MRDLDPYGLKPSTKIHSGRDLYFAVPPSAGFTNCTRCSQTTTFALSSARGRLRPNYLVDGLDLALIRKHPKIFIATAT